MMNFALHHHYGWSLSDLEQMMPFEREIYLILLKQLLEDQRRKQK